MSARTHFAYSDEPSLDIYLREIGRKPLLKPEEEVQLANSAKAGDRDAMDRLTECNLRFVVSIAKEFQHRGLSLADLINEGNMGLMKAVQHFDAGRGNRFSTYALWWIRQAILKALAQQTRTVRLPANRIDKLNRIYKAVARLKNDPQYSGRGPTVHQIAKEVKMPVDEVNDLLGYNANQVSLDAPYSEEGEKGLSEIMESTAYPSPEQALREKNLSRDIKTAMSVLTPREELILRMYFGLDSHAEGTLNSIGKQLRISRERVRQLRDRALKKIELATQGGRLRAYLN